MTQIIKELQELSGQMVKIVTLHKWFGKEKYSCQFDFIYDNMRIGFKVQNKEIYILKTELKALEKKDGMYSIGDSLMEIMVIP